MGLVSSLRPSDQEYTPMTARRWLLVLIVAAGPCLTATAADLAKIERTIKKEPAYQSKEPKYCLLVFGPEAETRVWLVVDDGAMYFDRNGNGDLTEEGKRVAGKGGF